MDFHGNLSVVGGAPVDSALLLTAETAMAIVNVPHVIYDMSRYERPARRIMSSDALQRVMF
jgi:hypothetical protein